MNSTIWKKAPQWTARLLLVVAALFALSRLQSVNAIAAESGAEQLQTININSATAEELTNLPGIGPSKAEAIVAFRKSKGAFKRAEDLLRVKGIGRKTLARLKPQISVGSAGAPAKTGQSDVRLRTTGVNLTKVDGGAETVVPSRENASK